MKTINLQITKTFKVGDKEYNSKEEAMGALAMEVLEKEVSLGVDNVISKASEIIQALRIINRQ
jgi:hypothetical protein